MPNKGKKGKKKFGIDIELKSDALKPADAQKPEFVVAVTESVSIKGNEIPSNQNLQNSRSSVIDNFLSSCEKEISGKKTKKPRKDKKTEKSQPFAKPNPVT